MARCHYIELGSHFVMPTNLQSAPQLRLVHEPDRSVPVERLGDVVGEQQVEETALSLLGEDVLK